MVVVHNDFNNVNLTGLKEKELDLLISLCYKLRDEGVEEVKLSFEELKKLSQYEDRHIERFVKDLDSVYKKLIELNFRYEDENKIIRFVLFKSYEIDKNNKTVTIAVNEKFKYILNQLTGNFTRFELNQFVSLNSQYAKHIFRFLKQFNGTGWREFLLSDFRELLNIPEKYRISEIDKYVLNEKILKELEKSFKNLKVFKLKNGRSVYKIRFEWAVEKKKEKEEIEVIPKTEKEKNTDKLIKKQVEDIELAEIINKEINEKYNNYLELSEEIKTKIEEKIYINFLEKAEATDNKIMRGIFEKSKKSLIVEEYEELLEEEKIKSIPHKARKNEIEVHNFSEEENIEIQAELGINLYTINENNYNREFFSYKKTDEENAKDEIENYVFKYDSGLTFGENIKEKSVENFLIINPLYNKQSLLDNFDTKEVRKLIDPYIAKEMSKFLFKTESKTYKVPTQKKLYTKENIPNELLLDKKGKILVGSAKENRIDKILREQKKY